jgi:hypothetical protein
VSHQSARQPNSPKSGISYYKNAIARKLSGVFKPDNLGRLVSRNRVGGQSCEVLCQFPQGQQLEFRFSKKDRSSVKVISTPEELPDQVPVYLPTRELLSIYPGFVSLYETTHLQFDETWRDTCLLLGAPLIRGSREKRIQELLEPLEEAMGGAISLTDSGGFYLEASGVDIEMHLVAEGLRKLAMIARLIATGALLGKGYLFWDEPEANLNPRVVRRIARTILHLCQNGIQVFIASHSLFLLRELDILLKHPEFEGIRSRFFGLQNSGGGVMAEQGDSIDEIGEIAVLQEELSQSDRYLETGAE